MFEKFQAELDIDDVRRLVSECERCRIELNKNITDKIEKKDTNPDVYTYLENLEAKEKEKVMTEKKSTVVLGSTETSEGSKEEKETVTTTTNQTNNITDQDKEPSESKQEEKEQAP